MMASGNATPLRKLLSLSDSLTPTPSESISECDLSLKQLVRVHESFLDFILANEDGEYSPTSTESSNNTTTTSTDEIDDSKKKDGIDQERKLTSIVKPLLNNDADLEKCVSILCLERSEKSNFSEQNVLMVVQYILRVSKLKLQQKSSACCLECVSKGLSDFIYPLLQMNLGYDTQLKDAILDACFHDKEDQLNDSLHKKDKDQYYEEVKDSLLTSSRSIVSSTASILSTTNKTSDSSSNLKSVVELSSKLLARLLTFLANNRSSISVAEDQLREWVEIILQSMFELTFAILNSICYSPEGRSSQLVANGKVTSLFRPVTALLLPTLFPSTTEKETWMNDILFGQRHEERVLKLWHFITNLISSHDSVSCDSSAATPMKKCQTWESTAPSIATGILCVVASSIHSISLPVPLNYENQNEAKTKVSDERLSLIHQPIIWNFLQLTLKNEMQFNPDWTGLKGGAGFSQSLKESGDDDIDLVADQMIRRRSIHIMGLLIEKEYASFKSGKQKHYHEQLNLLLVWRKYALCFEALEMEVEVHLVDQIFPTVAELCAECCVKHNALKDSSTVDITSTLPAMSWDWVGSLLSRILLSDSPSLRKLGLYRLMTGKAGISTPKAGDSTNVTNERNPDMNSCTSTTIETKGKRKKKSKKPKVNPAPLSMVSPSFIVNVVIPSYDSLPPATGKGVQFEVIGEKRSEDLGILLKQFLANYARAISSQPTKIEDFFSGILADAFINGCHTRTLVLVFDALSDSWSSSKDVTFEIPLANKTLCTAMTSLQKLLDEGSVVHGHHQSLLRGFATFLSYSTQKPDEKIDPLIVLKILALFPSPLNPPEGVDVPGDVLVYEALQKWINGIGSKWSGQAGPACAASFVSGLLIPYKDSTFSTTGALIHTNNEEQRMAGSIVKLCLLAGASGQASASSMLWPAISKVLTFVNIQVDNVDTPMPPFEVIKKISRSILLLECGCNEFILNGLGNGDLVLDKKGLMVPPPRHIENVLSSVINFLLQQVCVISLCEGQRENEGIMVGRARSNLSQLVSTRFSMVISQFECLKRAYPSSAITDIANDLAKKFLEKLVYHSKVSSPTKTHEAGYTMDMVKLMALTFASLTLGGNPVKNNESQNEMTSNILITHFRTILRMNFNLETKQSSSVPQWQLKTMRSIYQLSKWGSLQYLVESTIESIEPSAVTKFQDEIFDIATESIQASPLKALLALFETSIIAAKKVLITNSRGVSTPKEHQYSVAYRHNMNKIINTLFAIMNDASHKPTNAYMLNVICGLIFRPHLLLEEYQSFQLIEKEQGGFDTDTDAPILKAFQTLIEMAGNNKPHILKYALSYITVGWLGTGEQTNQNVSKAGLAAISYRTYILELLIFKEIKHNEATAHQEALVKDNNKNQMKMPSLHGTPETSIARGFLLIFISKLPNVGEGLSDVVLHELLHHVILRLLDEICCLELQRGKLLMTGSTMYSQKIRAWQALCLLSRFVTSDIAEEVSERVFRSMSQVLHGQIRYFLEAFAIKCATFHPEVFISKFVTEIRRRDLTQQHVSSLMIIGGNLIVGKYALSMFESPTKIDTFRLKEVLSGTIVWLSGTQGFCRAIAQLLVHKLIPKVIPTIEDNGATLDHTDENDWFLRSIFNFLEVHPEMKRLRQKQTKIFETYDVDTACTPEGCLQIPVDEGEDACPSNIVDVMKKSLVEIYCEAYEDVPTWKQSEDILDTNDYDETDSQVNEDDMDNGLVNFQRKILPLDSLNLVLEENDQKLMRNAAGRKRQSLIICATLIDKIPNIGGLARTAEIFAAEKLIVPDVSVCKMDNFKSLSAGAGDWIRIEQCRENELLEWLKQHKENGYTITGVEQTSSSGCLSKINFEEKTVLLLGKEKEGIPINFLQILDNCVEIPQAGIIRSLNVHVSGALAIWEYTKQMMIMNDLS